MTTVFLIRHGEIDNPKKILYGSNFNLKINDIGRKQIQEVAERIKRLGFKIGKIYSSPLSRAQESAKIIAKEFRIEKIITKQGLTDTDIPALADKPLAIRSEIFKTGTDAYDEKYVKMGNESRDQIVKRMKDTFNSIVKENKGKTAIIVSHGDPLQFLLYVLTNPDKKVPSMNILAGESYPTKGSATKLVLDENAKLIDREVI